MSTATQTRAQQATQDLFAPRNDADLPITAEVAAEIRSALDREPVTLSVLAAQDVRKAAEALQALQEASVRLTKPEDWLLFRAKDHAELCYLQDAGCQRVRPLWGISFNKFDPRRDLVADDGLGPTEYAVDAYCEARCALTGETLQEVGHRGAAGLFGKAWEDGIRNDDQVELARLRANVRKSAIANAQGRIVRRAAGLSAVPAEVVCRLLGIPKERLRSPDIQSGAKGGGGAGGGASDPQVKNIVRSCFEFHKVKDLGKILGAEAFEQLVRSAGLTGGREGTASRIIDRMMKAKRDEVTVAELESLLGVKIGPPAPAEREPGEEG